MQRPIQSSVVFQARGDAGANQALAAANTWYDLTILRTTDISRGIVSWDAATGRLCLPPGLYRMSLLLPASAGSATGAYAGLAKNGTAFAQVREVKGADGNVYAQVTALVQVTSPTDYYTARAFGVGAVITVISGSVELFFSVERV